MVLLVRLHGRRQPEGRLLKSARPKRIFAARLHQRWTVMWLTAKRLATRRIELPRRMANTI
jgi:hypothetical protein